MNNSNTKKPATRRLYHVQVRPTCGDIKGPPTGRIPIGYIPGNVETRSRIKELENDNSRMC